MREPHRRQALMIAASGARGIVKSENDQPATVSRPEKSMRTSTYGRSQSTRGVTGRGHATSHCSIPTRRRVKRFPIRSFSRSCTPTMPATRSCSSATRSAGRSTQAAQMLASRGYQHVINVRGVVRGARDPVDRCTGRRGMVDGQIAGRDHSPAGR